jgi:hypothetical protein
MKASTANASSLKDYHKRVQADSLSVLLPPMCPFPGTNNDGASMYKTWVYSEPINCAQGYGYVLLFPSLHPETLTFLQRAQSLQSRA